MEHEQQAAAERRQLVLPVLVFGMPEVSRLGRELEALEEFFQQSEIRAPGTQVQLPKVSRALEALSVENGCNLLVEAERQLLKAYLAQITAQAPRIHISFASDPSAAFSGKIVKWFRENIHPAILVQVGLQPTIAAGCVIRTPNKQFDFSLRHRFDAKALELVQALDADEAQAHAAAQAPAPASVVPVSTLPKEPAA